MKVLFDSNVLFAAFTTNGFCEKLVDDAADQFEYVWSDSLRDELIESLSRKNKLGPATHAALSAFYQLCQIVEPKPFSKQICRDADDDVVLATAIAANVQFIVSGDDDLLVLKNFEGISILSPRQFFEWMEQNFKS